MLGLLLENYGMSVIFLWTRSYPDIWECVSERSMIVNRIIDYYTIWDFLEGVQRMFQRFNKYQKTENIFVYQICLVPGLPFTSGGIVSISITHLYLVQRRGILNTILKINFSYNFTLFKVEICIVLFFPQVLFLKDVLAIAGFFFKL